MSHTPTESLRFERSRRITRRKDYLYLYDHGRRARSASMTVFGKPNGGDSSRIGLTVSRKVGGAVQRNRAKRVLREIFREHRVKLVPAMDLIVNAHREFTHFDRDSIERDFLKSFRRLTRAPEKRGRTR